MNILEKTIEEFKEKTKRECVEIHVEQCEDMTIYQSKFGGVPYIPDDFEYPYSRLTHRQPLKLLAQINFEEMPHIEDFPQKGILQIYINPDDDRFFGCDRMMPEEYEVTGNQSEYRIIYHENVDYSIDNTDKIPEIRYDNTDYGFLVEEPEKITFKKCIEYMPYKPEDNNDVFCETFLEIYNKYAGKKVYRLDKIEGCEEYIEQEFPQYYSRHKIGGYQDDIWDAGWMNNDILMLQITSDQSIVWGDDGIAHFNISREDLKKCDFSNVEYTWECY